MELNQIAHTLKKEECYCYQIAYFLLEEEHSAILATQQALLELAQSRSFFTASAGERRNSAKKAVTKHALAMFLNMADGTFHTKAGQVTSGSM